MIRTTFALALSAALPLAAESLTTRCQVEDVAVSPAMTDRRLVGCGSGFPDNILWNLDRADSRDGSLDSMVNRTATGKGTVVYVCDTGVMRDHNEFARADGSAVIAGIIAGRRGGPGSCSALRDPSLDPCYGSDSSLFILTHGTAVASVIAGKTSGVAPDAKIVSVYLGDAEVASWVSAMDQIIDHAWSPTTPPFRTAIINMSQTLGYASDSALFAPFEAKMRDMIYGVDAEGRRDPNGKRFLFVTIAGNTSATESEFSQCDQNGLTRLYPASLGSSIEGLIAVGGVDRENHSWSGACGGPSIDLLGPAQDVLVASTSAADHYRGSRPFLGVLPNSGTSYATPYVSGIAATMLETNPDLSPAELERNLKGNAPKTVDAATAPGAGRVAVYEATPMMPRRRPVRR